MPPPSEFKLRTSLKPHLHSGRQTRSVIWGIWICLLPGWAVHFSIFGPESARILLIALAAAAGLEWSIHALTKPGPARQNDLLPNDVILTMTLFGFLIPNGLPWPMITLGALTAVCSLKLFGGLGQNLFHPALVAHALLLQFFSLESLRGYPHGGSGIALTAAIWLGGMVMTAKKWAPWQVPLAYWAGASAISAAAGFHLTDILRSGMLALGAFFFAPDPAVSGITKMGRWMSGLAAGVLTAVFRIWQSDAAAVTYALLITEGLAACFDRLGQKAK